MTIIFWLLGGGALLGLAAGAAIFLRLRAQKKRTDDKGDIYPLW